jgi:O-antigen ligase
LVKGASGGDIFISGELTAQTGLPGHFIYSGALFIGIAIIYLVFKNGRRDRAIVFLLFLSLFLVGSRGYFLSLSLSAFCYVLIGPMRAIKKIGYGFIVILLAAILLPFLFSLSGNKKGSDAERMKTITQVSDRVTPISLIVGHGFGIGVPEKPGHEEIAYLEIFQKQGLIGLLWWAALIATLAVRFRKAIRSGNQYLAYPLFLSAIYVLLQSATNPAVNNPIGMYPFIISFVGLGVLARPDTPRSAMNLRGSIDMRDTGVVDGEIGFG